MTALKTAPHWPWRAGRTSHRPRVHASSFGTRRRRQGGRPARAGPLVLAAQTAAPRGVRALVFRSASGEPCSWAPSELRCLSSRGTPAPSRQAACPCPRRDQQESLKARPLLATQLSPVPRRQTCDSPPHLLNASPHATLRSSGATAAPSATTAAASSSPSWSTPTVGHTASPAG